MSYNTYYPEMNETKPTGIGTAQLGHYGKHYYVNTRLELKGRGIEFLRTLAPSDLVPSAQHRVGEHEYRVTLNAFKKLCEKLDFTGEILLD